MKILVPIWLPVNSLMSFISCKDLQNKFRCRSTISWRYIASILLNTTWCVSDMRSLEIFIVQQNEYLLKVNQTDCTWQDISIIRFSFLSWYFNRAGCIHCSCTSACILVGSANTNFTPLNTKSWAIINYKYVGL